MASKAQTRLYHPHEKLESTRVRTLLAPWLQEPMRHQPHTFAAASKIQRTTVQHGPSRAGLTRIAVTPFQRERKAPKAANRDIRDAWSRAWRTAPAREIDFEISHQLTIRESLDGLRLVQIQVEPRPFGTLGAVIGKRFTTVAGPTPRKTSHRLPSITAALIKLPRVSPFHSTWTKPSLHPSTSGTHDASRELGVGLTDRRIRSRRASRVICNRWDCARQCHGRAGIQQCLLVLLFADVEAVSWRSTSASCTPPTGMEPGEVHHEPARPSFQICPQGPRPEPTRPTNRQGGRPISVGDGDAPI